MSAVFRPLAAGLCLVGLPFVGLAQAPPATPSAAPAAKAEYHVLPLRPNLFVLTGAAGNIALWSGPSGTLLVDDGLAGLAPQLLETIARIAKSPVRFVVNTHWHPDHTGGNEALARAGALIVAHEGTRERMSQPQLIEPDNTRWPAAPVAALPTATFADAMVIHLDGERITVVHVSNAHTDADAVVRWQEANVVHVGDLVDSGGYPYIDLASGGSLAGVVAALEAVLARSDAHTVVIPGHGRVATRADLVVYRDMLVAVGRKVREQLEAGASVAEVLAVHPTAEYDARYAQGSVSPESFVRTLYRDLSKPRSGR